MKAETPDDATWDIPYWMVWVYAGAALATLVFQLWVRHGQCTPNDCWPSYMKAVLWSLFWPASWIVYLAGFV
jgi:hypothetical protein